MKAQKANLRIYVQCELHAAKDAVGADFNKHIDSGALKLTDPYDDESHVKDVMSHHPYNDKGESMPFRQWWRVIAAPMIRQGSHLRIEIAGNGVEASADIYSPWNADGAIIELDESRFDTEAAETLEAVRNALHREGNY